MLITVGGDGDDNYKQPTGDLFGSVALGPDSEVYFTGRTTSAAGFPTTSALQASFGGGAADSYVAKLSAKPAAPDLAIDIFPNAWLVSSGQTTGNIVVRATPLNGFSGTVDLACSGLPAYAACSFNPATVASSGQSTLTISTRQSAAQALLENGALIRSYAAIVPVFGLMLMAQSLGFSNLSKRRWLSFLAFTILFSYPPAEDTAGAEAEGARRRLRAPTL